MARPKEFDRDRVLEKAIKVFAHHGFEGASTDRLLQGMRISRQSMYDTYGDKRRLYLDALRLYSSESAAEIIGTMYSEPSAIRGIEAALLSFARPNHDACLGVGAMTEFGCSDPDVRAINDNAGATMLAAFERIVRKGQDVGEVSRDLEPKAVAQFLISTLVGMKVSARGGATSTELRSIVRMALRSLT